MTQGSSFNMPIISLSIKKNIGSSFLEENNPSNYKHDTHTIKEGMENEESASLISNSKSEESLSDGSQSASENTINIE
jgi:hypothetical protein